jgi:hypothetical protein
MLGRRAVSPFLCLAGLLFVLGGFDPAREPAESLAPQPVALGQQHDPAQTGTIRGQVTWTGPLPTVSSYRSPSNPLAEGSGGDWQNWPNPHTPRITRSLGLASAVVFLQEVDPQKSRPWNHPPARVEVREHQLHIIQGDTASSVGFVRRGEGVEFVSHQDSFVSLQMRGDDFFALPLPDRDQPRPHSFPRSGVVELMAGSGQFWMRGYLFVTEHPYFVRADAQGCFVLSAVPAGNYQLVCWHPDWREAGRELDADTGLVWRVTYRPPLCQVRNLAVAPGQTTEASFNLKGD